MVIFVYFKSKENYLSIINSFLYNFLFFLFITFKEWPSKHNQGTLVTPLL